MKFHDMLCYLDLPRLVASISSCIEGDKSQDSADRYSKPDPHLTPQTRWAGSGGCGVEAGTAPIPLVVLTLSWWILSIMNETICVICNTDQLALQLVGSTLEWHENAVTWSGAQVGRYYRKVCESLQIFCWLTHSWISVKSKFGITTSEIWWHSNDF